MIKDVLRQNSSHHSLYVVLDSSLEAPSLIEGKVAFPVAVNPVMIFSIENDSTLTFVGVRFNGCFDPLYLTLHGKSDSKSLSGPALIIQDST